MTVSADRPLRIVVVGEESAGVQVLRGLVAAPEAEIVAVLTTRDEQSGRRPLVHEAATTLGLETRPSQLVRDSAFAGALAWERIDLLLNVHSLFLIDPEVVAAPRLGSFNLHPGPLPGYAGLNAPSWAIFNGETTHAVTLHWMDSGIDTGPVAYSESFELSEDATGISVSGVCARRGVPLVLRLVDQAARNPDAIPRIDQDPRLRRYFQKGPPNEGRLDWSVPAADVVRLVRAADYAPFASPWGQPQADISGSTVRVAKAALTGTPTTQPPGTVRDITDAGATVAAADEYVCVQRIVVNGRSVRPAESELAL